MQKLLTRMRVMITGASRGIGSSIAKMFAKKHGEHAKISMLSRSAIQPSHHKLEGTLSDTADEISKYGSLPFIHKVDLRKESEVEEAVSKTMRAFDDKLDVLILNASVLSFSQKPKDIDLLFKINVRSTLHMIQLCKPYLKKSNGCIVSLSPPVRMGRLDWISSTPAYTISKYGMTMACLSAADTVRSNCLWPKRMIRTAATKRLEEMNQVPGAFNEGRDPEEFAKAIQELVNNKRINARCMFDEDLVSMNDEYTAPLDAYVDPPETYPIM